MRLINLKKEKISDNLVLDYKEILIHIVNTFVSGGTNIRNIKMIVSLLNNLKEQDSVILVTQDQLDLLKHIIENYDGWKFAHQTVIDFCNEIFEAVEYKSN